jgi:hypothetical protein
MEYVKAKKERASVSTLSIVMTFNERKRFIKRFIKRKDLCD